MGRFLALTVAAMGAIRAQAATEKVARCKQSCLGELVCSKTCDFLGELDGGLGSKIEACLKPCTNASCTNECVFTNVGLSFSETKAYVALENALSPCYKLANTAALDCANRQSCLQTDMGCIQKCSDQLENPQYVGCVAISTNTTAKDIDASNACRQACLARATDLKASYSCGVTCGRAYFKGLGLNLTELNLTDAVPLANETFKRNTTSSSSTSSAISPLSAMPLVASFLAFTCL